MLKYANSQKRKRIARIASVLAIIVMVPAVWTFVEVLRESNFYADARNYVDNELSGLEDYEYVKKNVIYKYDAKGSSIEFNTYGLGEVPQSTIDLIKYRKDEYPALANTEVIFNQSKIEKYDNMKYMEQLRYRDSLDLMSQTQKIEFLENRVKSLSALEKNTIPFTQVVEEVKINYENLSAFSYANLIKTNFKTVDTIPEFIVTWDKEKVKNQDIAKEQDKLERWLKVKLKLDTLVVRQIN
jgi:hypothetical protein